MPMKTILMYPLFIFAACLCSCGSDDDSPEPAGADDKVVFFDDFTSFDHTAWTKETHEAGWTNQELQSYAPSQVTIAKDGNKSVMKLTARRTNGRIVSGRVNSKNKRSFRYGKIEASIKLPKTANGLWPAFWMMGETDKAWPACGEIDIMEMGDTQGIADGTSTKRVNTAIHYGANVSAHEQQYYAGDANVNLQDGQYHVFGMTKTGDELKIYIDNTLFHTFDISDNAYFQNNFHIILNLAVGGSFTGINTASGITALREGEEVSMYIDWIKITK